MPEREPISEQIKPEYLALLDVVQKTPQVIDDLWLVAEVEINPYGLRAAKRLGELLAENGHTEEDWEFWLNYNATRALNYLINPQNYPRKIFQEILKKIPPERDWKPRFTVPDGYKIRGGIWSSAKDSFLGIQTQISPKGQRLPRIVINKPQETKRLFPWQTAHLANDFVREHNFRRFSSKYITVGGVLGHELVYTPREGRTTPIERLEYIQVSVIRGGMEYLFLTAAVDIEPHYGIYKEFIASVK